MSPILLTDEYLKAPIARAVPGAYWDSDPAVRSWVLPDDPDPRGAVVACRLFPGIEHDFPILAELRDSLDSDAAPHDYAAELGLRITPARMLGQLALREWSLSDDQELVLGYAEAVLREHKGFYLGAYRGWGKTLGTAALMDVLDTRSNLVVVPNSAKADTWVNELSGFDADGAGDLPQDGKDGRSLAGLTPWLEVLALPQDAKQRAATLARAQYLDAEGVPFVLLVHWEALAVIAGTRQGKRGKLPDKGWKKLGITWDLMVCDEGHRLANPKSLQSRAAKTVPATMKMLASGSVFQNRWEELFSPLQFLFPKRYKAAWRDWNNRFLDFVDGGFGQICVGIIPGREEDMRKELGVFMSYRERESTAIAARVMVELNPEQRRVYDELVNTCLAELGDDNWLKAKAGVAMLTRLRQIADGLGNVTDNALLSSSKIDAAVKVAQRFDARGDDYAFFVWYKPMAYALEAALLAAGYESFVITGDVKLKDRTAALAAFRAGERRCFIGTIPTIGESVNLQRANHAVRLNRPWNPAANRQIPDRLDRQGQTRQVYLTDIVAKDTVDELVVLPNLANKEALRRAVLGGRL